MHSRWCAIGVLQGLLLGVLLTLPAAHAAVIGIHTESRGMVALADIESDADAGQVADEVFQEEDDWSTDEAMAAEEGYSEEVAAEVFLAAVELADLSGTEIAAVESASAVPVPASVWLFGSGLLALLYSGRRNKV